MNIYNFNNRLKNPDKIEDMRSISTATHNSLLASFLRASLLCVYVNRDEKALTAARKSHIELTKRLDAEVDLIGRQLLEEIATRSEFKKTKDLYLLKRDQKRDREKLLACAKELGGKERTGNALDERLPKEFMEQINTFIRKYETWNEVANMTAPLWAYFHEYLIGKKNISFKLSCFIAPSIEVDSETRKNFESIVRSAKLEFEDDWVRSLFGKEFQSSKSYIMGTTLKRMFTLTGCYGRPSSFY